MAHCCSVEQKLLWRTRVFSDVFRWFIVVLGVFFHICLVFCLLITLVTNVAWGDGDRERMWFLAKLSDLTVTEHWNHG